MIRPVVPNDLPALKALIDATELFPSDLLDAMVAPFFNDETSDEYWVTDDDDGPQAFAYYVPERMTEGTWNLLLIAVHPKQQGQGRGAVLMQYIEQSLAARGERLLLVETSGLPSFGRTRVFYHKCGYDEEARIRDFYQVGEDKIVFRKVLVVSSRPS